MSEFGVGFFLGGLVGVGITLLQVHLRLKRGEFIMVKSSDRGEEKLPPLDVDGAIRRAKERVKRR